MSEMTPEKLRSWVKADRIGTHWQGCEASHKDCAIVAAVSAWEADRAHIKNFKKLHHTCRRLMEECLIHDADKVPDWLDELLADISLDLAALAAKPK